jgi:hypothetical protein
VSRNHDFNYAESAVTSNHFAAPFPREWFNVCEMNPQHLQHLTNQIDSFAGFIRLTWMLSAFDRSGGAAYVYSPVPCCSGPGKPNNANTFAHNYTALRPAESSSHSKCLFSKNLSSIPPSANLPIHHISCYQSFVPSVYRFIGLLKSNNLSTCPSISLSIHTPSNLLTHPRGEKTGVTVRMDFMISHYSSIFPNLQRPILKSGQNSQLIYLIHLHPEIVWYMGLCCMQLSYFNSFRNYD